MIRNREEYEKLEAKLLAPYAQTSAASRGRVHDEEPHTHRSQYQRDRDRIVHSRAFRRLEYKSQVFLNGAGDHYRTRLTHTIEVASIARSLARSLNLNEDLAEAIALAHDLGHSPFGHPGEHTLAELMKDHGGFEHNQQSLRVVEELELKYPEFNGLNLTWEVREGLAKHQSAPHLKSGEQTQFHQPSLEAQVADFADEIAYCCHDIDDGLGAGLLLVEDLNALSIWSELDSQVQKNYPRLEMERRHSYVLRTLLDHLVEDVVSTSSANLKSIQPTTPDQVRRHRERFIQYSAKTKTEVQQLRHTLFHKFYRHPSIQAANEKACNCLRQLFETMVRNPHFLGTQFALRVKKEGIHRATCDYLACMTDRYAVQEYQRIFGKETIEPVILNQPALF